VVAYGPRTDLGPIRDLTHACRVDTDLHTTL
jgi:hypothetical protein